MHVMCTIFKYTVCLLHTHIHVCRFAIPSLGTSKQCYTSFGTDQLTIPAIPGIVYYAPNNTQEGSTHRLHLSILAYFFQLASSMFVKYTNCIDNTYVLTVCIYSVNIHKVMFIVVLVMCDSHMIELYAIFM